MKRRNLKIAYIPLLVALITVMTGAAVLFSCKRDLTPPAANNNMAAIEQLTGGYLLTGSVTVETGEDALLLNINKGQTQVLVSRIAGMTAAPIHNMSSAQVVVSSHGIVVKDLANDQVFFFTNNDAESIAQFDKARSMMHFRAYNDRIIGTMVVHS